MDEQQGEDVRESLSEREDKEGVPERLRLTPTKLNMSAFDISPDKVFQDLFGRPAYRDERTGELLFNPRDVFSQHKEKGQ